MNEFRFNHLKNRRRMRVPRPVLYVGVAIILLAFFSVKYFERAGETDTSVIMTAPGAVPAAVPDQGQVIVPEEESGGLAVDEALPLPVSVDDEPGGILSLDGTGRRLHPPRRISGGRPEIPPDFLDGTTLDSPRVFVRVGKDGLVSDLKLVSSSGRAEVDRLVLEALAGFTFHPATSAGRPVEYSSVVTVSLAATDDTPPGPDPLR